MANAYFTVFRNNVWGDNTFAFADALDSTIKSMLVDHGVDTPVPATDNAIDAIASGARVPALGACPTLASKTVGSLGAGVFNAAATTFASLSGASAESLILLKDTGTESTSLLIAFWDTATGLPVTPSGGNVVITWNASGIGQF